MTLLIQTASQQDSGSVLTFHCQYTMPIWTGSSNSKPMHDPLMATRFGLDNIYFWKAPAAAGTDTTLSALTVDGNSIAGFGPTSTSYSVELPVGTTVVPTVAATPTDTNASAVVNAATSIPGTTTVVVTAQDGVTTSTVSIAWSIDPKPQTAAPAPSHDSANVISVYSDAFADNINTNLNPGWGQATQASEVQIAGNNTLEYANLNYQGMELTQTDVSAMEYVHFDYYTDDATSLKFSLISPAIRTSRKRLCYSK